MTKEEILKAHYPSLIRQEDEFGLASIYEAMEEYAQQQLFIHGINYCKPTYSEKNKLPSDIKYSYHKGVEFYQTIMHYENGIIGADEFTAKMREIEKAYCG